jgi:hypothetical protein
MSFVRAMNFLNLRFLCVLAIFCFGGLNALHALPCLEAMREGHQVREVPLGGRTDYKNQETAERLKQLNNALGLQSPPHKLEVLKEGNGVSTFRVTQEEGDTPKVFRVYDNSQQASDEIIKMDILAIGINHSQRFVDRIVVPVYRTASLNNKNNNILEVLNYRDQTELLLASELKSEPVRDQTIKRRLDLFEIIQRRLDIDSRHIVGTGPLETREPAKNFYRWVPEQNVALGENLLLGALRRPEARSFEETALRNEYSIRVDQNSLAFDPEGRIVILQTEE